MIANNFIERDALVNWVDIRDGWSRDRAGNRIIGSKYKERLGVYGSIKSRNALFIFYICTKNNVPKEIKKLENTLVRFLKI